MRGPDGARGRWLAMFAMTMALALPVSAHPTSSELSEKFARGEYMSAAREAEAAGAADDLAFAARALLAHCMTGTEAPDSATVDRASKDAEAALKLDPGHEEGRLQLAIALSLKSRQMDAMAAWTAGYGEKGKKLAEQVLAADPANFYAHGFLAVWNIEVMQRGGDMGAWMMGASLDDARKHYEEATRLAPEDAGINWQYARALTALDAVRYEAEAMQALDRAMKSQPSNHVSRVMSERAAQLALVLRTDKAAAQKLARGML